MKTKLIENRKKLLVFHPAIMPYRIDFFNSLSEAFNADFYFLWNRNLNQKMDEELMRSKLLFTPKYLTMSVVVFKRVVRIEVFNIIKNIKPDIVIMGEYSFTTFLALLVKKIFKIKCSIFTICDDSLDISMNIRGMRKFSRSLLGKYLDGVILTNKEVCKYYEDELHIKNLYCFPIIQEEENFKMELLDSVLLANQFVKDYNLINNKVFMFVGRLTSVKNLFFLIKCFHDSLINKEEQNAKLVLVGDGDLKDELIGYVAELNLQNIVLFVGKHEGVSLKAWFNIGQVFVLPSLFERFGAVTNEALLSGQFVLCSDLAGSKNLISLSNGAVFSPSNHDELTALLTKFYSKIKSIDSIKLRNSKMEIKYTDYINGLIMYLNNG